MDISILESLSRLKTSLLTFNSEVYLNIMSDHPEPSLSQVLTSHAKSELVIGVIMTNTTCHSQ